MKVTVHHIPLFEELHYWRLHSKAITFTVGRTYSPSAALTLSTRTIPSSESKTSIILQSDHFPRGKFSSFTITNAHFLMFAWLICYLFLCCTIGKFSDNHLFQNCLVIATTCFHVLRLDLSPLASWHTSPLLLNLPRRK